MLGTLIKLLSGHFLVASGQMAKFVVPHLVLYCRKALLLNSWTSFWHGPKILKYQIP
nr:hypothetical protein Iba_chr02bCG10570 [Ipomoea batatas]